MRSLSAEESSTRMDGDRDLEGRPLALSDACGGVRGRGIRMGVLPMTWRVVGLGCGRVIGESWSYREAKELQADHRQVCYVRSCAVEIRNQREARR